jgi:YHS domain-containing protein
MNFIARVFRYLFWVLIVSWAVRLLGRIVGSMLRGGAQSGSAQASAANTEGPAAETSRRLVRDPVCGMHLAEVLAVPLRESGEILHFCSTACRDAYVGSTRKIAANG